MHNVTSPVYQKAAKSSCDGPVLQLCTAASLGGAHHHSYTNGRARDRVSHMVTATLQGGSSIVYSERASVGSVVSRIFSPPAAVRPRAQAIS